ncbi:MAG: pilus assembly protein [Peptococcaceae bacterium]|nr:pilus assembly protein [Peptococcaceae bacterium]
MLIKLHKSRRGQAFVESLFVIPLLFMLFIFIVEMGFLVYNWAVINFHTCNTAVVAATKGRFTDEIRLRLAQNINDWTVNSRGYSYDVTGTDPPGSYAEDTVYIYGTDRDTPVQRGSYIHVHVNYPWHFKFFLVDSLSRFAVSEENLRIKVNASVPSEVFNESL